MAIATLSIATLSIKRAAPTMTDTQAAASICDYPGWPPVVTGCTMLNFLPFGLRYPPQAVFLAKGAKKAKAAMPAKRAIGGCNRASPGQYGFAGPAATSRISRLYLSWRPSRETLFAVRRTA